MGFGFRTPRNSGIPLFFDDRTVAELKAAIAKDEAELVDANVLIEYCVNKRQSWRPESGPYSGPDEQMARDEAARIDRQLSMTKHTLRVREEQVEDDRRRATMQAQAWQYETDHGLPHLESEQTPDQRHAEQQAARAAYARANPATFDPFSKEGKKQLAAELDARDPFKKGNQPIDAMDVLAGRVDGPGRR